MGLLESGGSIATINHNPPSYQTHSELFATINHTPPVYQPPSDAKLSVTNTVRNLSKPVMILERIASDIDARFSKSELTAKAQKATTEFLDALAPESTADVNSAVQRFQNSMNEISARIEKFQTSSLSAGVELNISNTIYKMAAQKFSETDLQVKPARISKVRQALELANEHDAGTTGSLAGKACKHIADQTLKIFQEAFFANLKTRTKQITSDLLAAAEPGSTITIADATKVFSKQMTAISNHREHFKDHDLYNDFVDNIKAASNAASSAIYYADEEKANMADWKAKSRKLAEENSVPVDETYPKDILTPKSILAKQLRWMKEEDFSNQVKASIKEVFPRRYEWIVTVNVKNAKDITDVTKLSIESLKQSLLKICIGKDEQEISKFIQKQRKDLAQLLMAGDNRLININSGPNAITDAIHGYLKNNDTELDLAIGGMIIDHIKDMQQRKIINDN